MANYNLPGVYTFYRERGLMMAPAAAIRATDSILFLGTATDGPKNAIVKVERPQDALGIFGSYSTPKGGNAILPLAFCEAYYAGARNIYLMRVTGKDASLVLSDAEGEVIRLLGKYPGSKYNDIEAKIETDAGDGEKKLSLPESDVVFVLSEMKSVQDLADQVNLFAELSGVRAEVINSSADVNDLVEVSGSLSGGDDELEIVGSGTSNGQILLGSYSQIDELGNETSATGYRAALEGAYELLAENSANIIVPLGVNLGFTDGSTPSINKTDANKLAEFCYEAAGRNNDLIGMIAVAPFKDITLSGIKTEAEKYAAADNTYTAEDEEDIGKYISVVLGEGLFNDRFVGMYSNVMVAAYAGLVSTLPLKSGSTNKSIEGVAGLRYQLSASQAEALRANKITTVRDKFGRGATVVEGIVASLPSSDFQSLSTIRTIHGVMDAVRDTVDPFLGESLDIHHVSSLQSAIQGTLESFVADGTLSGARFELLFPEFSAILGDIDVQLELEIASELRRVLVTVSRQIPELNR